MRVLVIGGTGHVGSYLVPRLVRAGHRVSVMSRGHRRPYHDDPAWSEVERLDVDREQAERSGEFLDAVVGASPDAVVDLVCFTVESAQLLLGGLRGRDVHLLHCGSIWMHGPAASVPIPEDGGTPPVGDYGVAKAAIARLLIAETRSGGLRTTSLHPGHISGPGWPPINPQGNLDPAVWQALAAGEPLLVAGIGTELMHHVHADDVAQAFQLSIQQPEASVGEMFHVCAANAMSVRGYASAAAGWFGQEAHLEHLTWDAFRAQTSAEYAQQSWDHLWRSQYASIDHARSRLGYAPAYTAEQATRAAVAALPEAPELLGSS